MGRSDNVPVLLFFCLAVVTFLAFWPVRNNEFVQYDDGGYITENAHVQAGVTLESVVRAFTKPHFFMWHPLTTLSHMLDCQLFGLNPSGHHLVSLFFHLANTLLLFWVLNRMTGALWPSVFVAAVFALHPLQVESVAWAAERKNVLSGFFWILTMAVYMRYARRPNIGSYLLVVLAFSCGLMSKPTVVTLPFVLLLLDYWPLGRFHAEQKGLSLRRLIVEKLPLFILSALLSVVTFVTQHRGDVIKSSLDFSLPARISNALVSYVSYIIKMLYPSKLAVLYPHPGANLPAWQPIVSLLILVLISLGVLYMARRQQYLAVGWLWFLGTLVPVIGLVQAGIQAMADRYAYLSSIGILIMVTWATAEARARWHLKKYVIAVPAVVILVALFACTRVQLRYWQNDLTLFGRTLEVTTDNYAMHFNFGNAIEAHGDVNDAIYHYRQVIKIKPDHIEAHSDLGNALQSQGRLDEAISHHRRALEIKPDYPIAHNNLGMIYAQQNRLDEALSCFRRAVSIKPDFAVACYNLASALQLQGNLNEAIRYYSQALWADPNLTSAHNNLGIVLKAQGRFDEAISCFRRDLQIDPNLATARKNLDDALRAYDQRDED